MDDERRKPAPETRNLPTELQDYFPARRWRGTLAALIVLATVALVFLGQLAYIQIRHTREVAELDRNEAIWNSKGIPSYEFTLTGRLSLDRGGLRSKAHVTVENGAVTSLEYLPDLVALNEGRLELDSVDTIPELFAEARRTLAKGTIISIPAFSASVAYDPEFGYPISISYGLTSFLGHTGDYSYQATFLRVLPYPQPAD